MELYSAGRGACVISEPRDDVLQVNSRPESGRSEESVASRSPSVHSVRSVGTNRPRGYCPGGGWPFGIQRALHQAVAVPGAMPIAFARRNGYLIMFSATIEYIRNE